MKCSYCNLGILRKRALAEGKFMHVIPREAPVVEVKFTAPDEVLEQGPGSVFFISGTQLVARFPEGIPDTCLCGWRGGLERFGRLCVKKLHKLIQYR